MKTHVCLIVGIFCLAGCANENLYHKLEVVNGSGSGTYALGQRISITADLPEAGFGFFEWTGDVEYLAEPGAPTTTVDMPLEDISVQATYKDLPRFDLSIINGSGSGSYLEGTHIAIVADPAGESFVFERWVGDTQYVEMPDTSETFVNMPDMAVLLEATYKEVENLISFRNVVFPIFMAKCSYSGCHDENSSDGPYVTYAQIKADLFTIEESIVSGRMPQSGPPLTASEKDKILTWIEQGALDN